MNEGGRRGGEEPRKGKLEDEARGNESPRRSGVACVCISERGEGVDVRAKAITKALFFFFFKV